MIKLKYGETLLDVYNNYEITKSSQDVVYSDLQCDFTGRTAEELPEKYQEVSLVDIDNLNNENVLYFGYVESYNFGEMRELDVDTTINLTLFSPMKLATLRTTIAIGTYQLKDLLTNTILDPLIEEGFKIKEIDITDRQVTTNYLVKSVEYCMNNLSNKFNFWWFIDEHKNIYIKDISKLISEDPRHIYDNQNSIEGLQYIKPYIEAENYANVINFTNVRIYEFSRLLIENGETIIEYNPLVNNVIQNIKNNEQINFNFPVDIKKENILKSAESNGEAFGYIYGISIKGEYSDGTFFHFYVRYNVETKSYEISDNIGFDGENEDKDFLLIRDSFFNNLIVGFKYNNQTKNISVITSIYSDSALIWNINRMYNDYAIADKKNIISKTGIVEATVDMQESWKTIQELQDIGKAYMDKNSFKFDGQIELKTDRNIFNVGDIIHINKMLFNDKYIVTQIREIIRNNDEDYIVICKNANLLNNAVDVFRAEDRQENEEREYKLYITHYNKEEILERHEVVQ